MLACPACDSPNEDRAHRCVRCGAELPQSPTVDDAPGTRRMGRTMLGVMPTQGASATAAPMEPHPTAVSQGGFVPMEPAPATLAGPQPQLVPSRSDADDRAGAPNTLAGLAAPKTHTLMGFGAKTIEGGSPARLADKTTGFAEADHSPAPEPTPVNAPVIAGKAAFKGTLLGVAPLLPTAANSSANTENTALPTTNPLHHRTMLGVAPPIAMRTDTPPVREALATLETVATVPPEPSHQARYHKGTLLGVAMPGIAPLNPGIQKGDPRKVEFASPRTPNERPVTPTSIEDERHAAMSAASFDGAKRGASKRAAQSQRLAWVFGIASSLLVVIITVATLVWWKTVHLTVSVGTSESNAEQLQITCSNCQSGTVVSLQGQSATFREGRAELKLSKKLSIGSNRLSLEVKRPNRTQREIVNAIVPVEFRVTSDLTGLSNDPPQLLVIVEARPKTLIQIDERTLTVGATGKLTVPVDATNQLLGANASVVPFERKLDYTVTQQDGSVATGSLVARTGITALEIASPGLDHITPTATFTLSGRTSPKAKITANGHPLSVAKDGTFRQDMALSAPGATRLRVRSQEDGFAPRLVDISIERVTNLRQRAEELGRSLDTTYDAIIKRVTEKPNSLVALHGEVVAQESTGPTTRLVVSANCQQTPCLASVRHGAPLSFKRGARIIAIGHGRLTKRATGDARDLTIDATLVIEETPQ